MVKEEERRERGIKRGRDEVGERKERGISKWYMGDTLEEWRGSFCS